MNQAVRPTKKQQELLRFIKSFIAEHGYSPSYREIMNGLEYGSVATVALHVGNLIKRGHLRKRDHSARSIEVVTATTVKPEPAQADDTDAPTDQWLIAEVERRFALAEGLAEDDAQPPATEDLAILVAALGVLGFDDSVQRFMPRLQALNPTNTPADT